MKRIIACLVVLLMTTSCTLVVADELTFQAIPWLSNETTVIEHMTDAAIVRDGSIRPLLHETGAILKQEDGFIWPAKGDQKYKDICVSVSFADNAKGKIAGYPIKDIILTYAYNGEYQLIAIKVKLINADYESIKKKIEKKYGEGEHLYDEEGLESVVWKGDNESCIVLFTMSEGIDYELIYGRLDAEEILANCLISDPDDVSGL